MAEPSGKYLGTGGSVKEKNCGGNLNGRLPKQIAPIGRDTTADA